MLSAISSFDFQPRTRLIYGIDTIDRLGDVANELGCSRVLIVTDAGIVAAGHVTHGLRALESVGVEASVFDGVRENPTTLDVDACVAVAREMEIDGIVGLGGGSSLDTAKGCNFLLSNGGRMQDYWGIGKATKPMLPLIAIPTTAGTGSECQSFALIADEETHQKMACGDPKAAARVAILDPALTLSQPQGVTACTGIDALAHAVETAVTRKRNAISSLYSREAFRLIVRNLPTVLEEPDNLDARASMLLGAAFAGIAIENSMLGAAHSAANPLTAHYGTVHGQAVGMMLPHVVRFNAQDPAAREQYREWTVFAGLVRADADAESAAEALASALSEMLERADLSPAAPDGAGHARELPVLAAEAARQWTAGFNPRRIEASDFEELYRRALPTA
jgi:alcohol dehydrogenase